MSNPRTGRHRHAGGYPDSLARLATPASLVEILAANRLVIGDVDGTHMGLAINWWEQEISRTCSPDGRLADAAVIGDIVTTSTGAEALRSAIEVLLSMVDWVARNDAESNSDHGVRLLNGLAGDILLLPSQRILCSDLARVIATEPRASEFVIHRVDVDVAMRLLVYLSRAIEHRFEVPVARQIATYRDTILGLAREETP